MQYGWMGRSPDYKAAFLATLGANAEFYTPYQENARRWYRESQERVLYFNHAIVNRRLIATALQMKSVTYTCTSSARPMLD